MKVFLPFEESRNLYLKEIQNLFKGTFTYGEFKDYKPDYDIVNIHWPESLFKWLEPSVEQLNFLETQLELWKKHSKIIVVIHNEHPHYKKTKIFKKLYDLVLSNAHGFIHLGQYSKNIYFDKYNNAMHTVIEHPLYTSFPNSISKIEARKKLNISSKAKVILVFGVLRSEEEEKMMLNAFKKLKLPHKTLLVPRFNYHFLNKKNRVWRKFVRYFYTWHPQYFFKSKFVKNEEIQIFANAADVFWVVRKKGLNSGNVFLSWSFKKNVIAPQIGNMGEEVENVGGSVYDPNNINSIKKAILKGLNTNFNNLDIKKIEAHHPKMIANKFDNFFEKIINEK
ncbi:hypothetical protein ACFLSU_01365 [Bacteroidota bacterium]